MGYPKDTWVRAYLKGNLLMPQAYEAGAVFLARTVLEGRPEDLEWFKAATHLHPHQLARIRRSMQRAHRVRRVPAGDSDYLEQVREDGCEMQRAIVIDDDKLSYIWNRFRGQGVAILQVLSQQTDGSAFARRLADGFRTPQCRALLRYFRAQYDRRNKDGSDSKAGDLRSTILACVEHYVREAYPWQPEGFVKSLISEQTSRKVSELQ